ncbi:MAG: DUF4972 domain-containing protein, partial [Dehalococcoidia bacterium]|nr:DUF4972 domain-containing protein [Dehalococcoidia bacterium]
NNAAIGSGNGQYPQNAINALTNAITAAQAVADTPAKNNTQAAVDKAVADLQKAIDDFNASVVKVDYSALNALIAQARNISNNSTYGDKNGDYPTSAKAALDNAIAAAQNVANNTTATQSVVNNAVSELQNAINDFNNSEIVVNYQSLKDLLVTAENAKNNASAGNGNGQTPQSAIDALQNAIDAAQRVADNNHLSQSSVDSAYSDLTSALAIFHSSKVVIDFTLFDTAIADAKSVEKGNYTDDSWDALQESIANADTMRSKAHVTQAEIDSAIKAMTDARAALQEKSKVTWLWICLAAVAVIAIFGVVLFVMRRKHTV